MDASRQYPVPLSRIVATLSPALNFKKAYFSRGFHTVCSKTAARAALRTFLPRIAPFTKPNWDTTAKFRNALIFFHFLLDSELLTKSPKPEFPCFADK